MKDYGVNAQDLLGEKYRLKSLLGSGGMGSVWLADHLTLGSEVAVKVLKPHVASDENSRLRFLREAKAAAALRSPHVVQILDHGSHENTVFIVMERMVGEELGVRLKREKRLPAADVYRILSHVARALTKAHELKIVHRDLKPANIFLIHNDDEFIAKVLDFGIAKSAMTLDTTDSPQTKTGVLLGTPYYVSPEQAQGTAAVDHRSDLWAMGIIAFECLCGRRPFTSDSLVKLLFQICGQDPPVPSQFAPVPAGFDDWFAKALARDPDERFQSAREMIDGLKGVLVPMGSSGSTGLPTPLPAQLAAAQVEAERASQRVPAIDGIDAPPESKTLVFEGSSPGTLNAFVSDPTRRRRRVASVLGIAMAAIVGLGVIATQRAGSKNEAPEAAAAGSEAAPRSGVGSITGSAVAATSTSTTSAAPAAQSASATAAQPAKRLPRPRKPKKPKLQPKTQPLPKALPKTQPKALPKTQPKALPKPLPKPQPAVIDPFGI
jgi:serine/threonine-protein kinase